MQPPVSRRYEARRTTRRRVLLAVMIIASVLGVAIIGVAANMAKRVEAFRSARTGAYWAGVICVALFLLYIPAHFLSTQRPDHQASKALFSFWVFLASFAAVCLFFAALIAMYYISLIEGTDQNSCVYYNATGLPANGVANRETDRWQCQVKCKDKFNGAPKRTCCCCHTEVSHHRYSGIYVQGIDNCSDLFGVVAQSAYALSAINCVASFIVLLASILGCGLCCRCCMPSASWTPPAQEIVLVTAEPTSHDKAPLLEGAVVGLDVPPPYSSN